MMLLLLLMMMLLLIAVGISIMIMTASLVGSAESGHRLLAPLSSVADRHRL